MLLDKSSWKEYLIILRENIKSLCYILKQY